MPHLTELDSTILWGAFLISMGGVVLAIVASILICRFWDWIDGGD